MYPKIISIGFAVPPYYFTQKEIFHRLGYPKLYQRLFVNSGIEKRHFWISLNRIPELSFQEQQEEYFKGAMDLSGRAIRQCLDGRDASKIKCFTFSSCTGFSPGPTIPHYLARDIPLAQDTYICNISAHGCDGSSPGLKRAADFTAVTGSLSMVVTCELSSCAIYPEPGGIPDPKNDLELMRAGAIFGDAASCALIGYDDDWRHPSIIDTQTHIDTDYLGELGFTWKNGRLRVRLSRDIASIAARVLKPAVETLMSRNSLSISDIDWYVIHAGGNAVIDNIRDALAIPEEKTQLSRETLKQYGNTSSSSIGITGKMLMSCDIKPGDTVLVLSVGPGMTGGAILMRFGTDHD
jgi:alkylresorcinol/alkylpyrone synthase